MYWAVRKKQEGNGGDKVLYATLSCYTCVMTDIGISIYGHALFKVNLHPSIESPDSGHRKMK